MSATPHLCAPVRIIRRSTASEAARLDRAVRRLRERQLSHRAIVEVLDLYEETVVTEAEVRSWLVRLGFEKNPSKARRTPAHV